ncbi:MULTISPECIES: DUF6415 family natural product biosynthesis protein [unclassified Streptomyces]|uniref:DUF6415 family natural product biosynthesis protein n=1 Tax=unclassified Streptomyces TaxID=2593676 RepID=UPI002E809848|nr:DUF6415 family natural product biosynthesis protein [Streptomyces sp. NBC_00589]WTI37459.1 DUF6415 family natural product biosynthesis protein [Streptomyces sp. NBC_00775]WUB28864.1 DUF6415 family natural product biosynthesis protein [Streptomyces sp. NBC_00589]
MNVSASIPCWTRPVLEWTPLLDSAALTSVLAKVREWRPYDGDALLDDIGAVLDDVVPPEEDLEELAQRLRGHLMQLVDIAVASEASEKDEQAERQIRLARQVRSEDMPGDHWQAVGHLRRMAWSVNELLERLVAIQCLKEPAAST